MLLKVTTKFKNKFFKKIVQKKIESVLPKADAKVIL